MKLNGNFKTVLVKYIVFVFFFSNVPTWNFYIEDELVASGEYETVEQARDGLTVKAYDDFKRYCFTLIQVNVIDCHKLCLIFKSDFRKVELEIL